MKSAFKFLVRGGLNFDFRPPICYMTEFETYLLPFYRNSLQTIKSNQGLRQTKPLILQSCIIVIIGLQSAMTLVLSETKERKKKNLQAISENSG